MCFETASGGFPCNFMKLSCLPIEPDTLSSDSTVLLLCVKGMAIVSSVVLLHDIIIE
jgi:hypothetical protein